VKKLYWVLMSLSFLVFGNEAKVFGDAVIDEIPPAGIIISTPGTYLLKKNLEWHPEGDGAAISITGNGVILDMQGHTLRSSTTNFKTTGISASICQNLDIKNGTIENMGLAGIQSVFCVNVNIYKIEVDGLNHEDVINFVVPTGILASESINVTIDKCTVKNIDVRTASCTGIQLTATIISKVTNCKVRDLFNRDGACSGIGHIACSDILIDSCRLNNIKTTFIDNLNTQGHTAIGIIPTLSTGITINNCVVCNVKGSCDDAHGMSIFLCENAIVTKSKVFHVIDGLGSAKQGAKATGIEIYGNNVLVSDCYVKDIVAINPEDKQSTGFSCGASENVQFIRCKARDVKVFNEKGKHSDSLGYGTGFGWAPDPRPDFLLPAINVLYQDCNAKHCQVGFDSWFHINSVWDRVTSIENEIAVLNLGNSAQRTLSCGPCSECGCTFTACYPTPYVVTVNNVADNNTFLVYGENGIILKGE